MLEKLASAPDQAPLNRNKIYIKTVKIYIFIFQQTASGSTACSEKDDEVNKEEPSPKKRR